LIRRAATYLLFITLMMYLLRWLHYQGLLRQEKGYYAKYRTAFFQKNAYDILFLGSSRAEMHYNTVLFDSLCGKNSFNLSLAGATPRIAFAALKAYLHNSDAPSELIYEADYHALQWPAEDIKEFNNYFPFLKNPVLLREFSRIDRRMPHFYLNPFYSFPYTGLKNISTSLHGWLGIANATDSLYFKGFVRETRRPALRLTRSEPQRAWIHPVERQYLDSILTLCKAMQIRDRELPHFRRGQAGCFEQKADHRTAQEHCPVAWRYLHRPVFPPFLCKPKAVHRPLPHECLWRGEFYPDFSIPVQQ
jgi:hypothetical protein